jgi:hypothetical protein
MKQIFSSASKIVLLLFSVATVVGLFTGKISEDLFKTAMLIVLTYYFTSKIVPNTPTL